MRTCAIICEYNPFHTGHKYQIDVARNYCDRIVCVMSGNFVQSTEPAFCDKSLRAECALKGGADAVIELPAYYATASAGDFAAGAVGLISKIKNIDCIAMGASADRDDILRLARIKSDDAKYTERFRTIMKDGKSYNAANAAALASVFMDKYGKDVSRVFDDPNNILCIEYVSSLIEICPNIEPLIIKRRGSSYNDISETAEYVSATAVRRAFEANKTEKIKKYIPYIFDSLFEFNKHHKPDLNKLNAIIVYTLKTASADRIASLRDCSEGIEFLLKSESSVSSLNGLLEKVSNRRYGNKRLKRIFLDLVLGINKEIDRKRFVTRLLGCRRDFDFSILPECVKTNNAEIKNAASDSAVAAMLKIDERAAALYYTICGINGDYYAYSLVKL